MKTAAFRPEEGPKISLVKTSMHSNRSLWVIPFGITIWIAFSAYYVFVDFQPTEFQKLGNVGIAVALITFAIHRYFRQGDSDAVDQALANHYRFYFYFVIQRSIVAPKAVIGLAPEEKQTEPTGELPIKPQAALATIDEELRKLDNHINHAMAYKIYIQKRGGIILIFEVLLTVAAVAQAGYGDLIAPKIAVLW